MNRKKMRILMLVPAFLLLVALPLASACAPAEEVEEVKGVIKVGICEDLTGPASGICTHVADGIVDYFRYVNEEEGGILGHELKGIVVDNKMDAAMAADGWERLTVIEDVQIIESVSLIVFGPMFHENAKRDKVAWFGGSGSIKYMIMDAAHEGESYSFATFPLYVSRQMVFLEYIKEKWADEGKPYPIKIGSIAHDQEDYRRVAKFWRLACEEDPDLELVATTWAESPLDSATTQVMALKEAQADVVICYIYDQPYITFIKDCGRLDYKPWLRIGHTTIIGSDVPEAEPELAEGTTSHGLTTCTWADTDIPVVQLMHDMNAKWHGKVEDRKDEYLGGWQEGTVIGEALRRTIERVGYENLDGEQIKITLETTGPFVTGMEAGAPPFEFSPSNHVGMTALRLMEIRDGDVVSVTEYIKFPPLTDEEKDWEYWAGD